MSNGGAVAAAAVAAKRKRIYNVFRQGNAVTASGAKTLREIGLAESPMFHMLVRRKEIVKVDADRYYLDEEAVASARKRRIMIIVGLILMGSIVLLLLKSLGY